MEDHYQTEIQNLTRVIEEHNKEFHTVASTHVSWTIFWSVVVLMVGVFTGVISFVLREKSDAHNKIDDRLLKLEVQGTDAKVSYAQIQTQLISIQKDLTELKDALDDHAK